MKLAFATNNMNKAREIGAMLPESIEILTLKDLAPDIDIPETANTLEGNAILKANYLTQRFNLNSFADDTGLEIEALNNEPGVRSARYAGETKNDDANIELVLTKMKHETNRKARFRTIIALNWNGDQFLFEGIVTGVIRFNRIGNEGFGYDPIFEPEGCGKTFAEMTLEEKNTYSHRARAIQRMLEFFR